MARKIIKAEGLPAVMGPYAQITEGVGSRLVFISGQVPEDEAGHLVGEGDVLAQARQVMANLRTAARAAGGGLEDICKLTIFLASPTREAYQAVADARREVFGEGFPASTLVEVKSLARPEWRLEVEAFAVM